MSEKRWNVVIAGLSHDHIWGELAHWKNLPNAKIIGVAETDTRLIERFSAEFPDVPVFSSTDAMYSALSGQANITQIAAPNAHHAHLAVEAFANGCHVITEKPMASTLADALAVRRETGLAPMSIIWSPCGWGGMVRISFGGEFGGGLAQPRVYRTQKP